jgi:hypothetical protein
MVQGKLLSVENLQKKGIVGPSWCAFCKYETKLPIIFSLIVNFVNNFGINYRKLSTFVIVLPIIRMIHSSFGREDMLTTSLKSLSLCFY